MLAVMFTIEKQDAIETAHHPYWLVKLKIVYV